MILSARQKGETEKKAKARDREEKGRSGSKGSYAVGGS